MNTTNTSERRANMSRQIEHRDNLINLAIEAMNIVRANPDISTVSRQDMGRVVDAGEQIQQWVDSDYIVKSFPGVRARLLDALVEIGFTREIYADACRAYAELSKAKPGTYECGKCWGKGRLNWTRHAEGVCFACKGAGTIVIK